MATRLKPNTFYTLVNLDPPLSQLRVDFPFTVTFTDQNGALDTIRLRAIEADKPRGVIWGRVLKGRRQIVMVSIQDSDVRVDTTK